MGPKNARFPYFRLEFENTIVIFETSVLEFALSLSLAQKKSLNLGPKMPHLGIFWLEFEINIVTFEISTLKFVLLQNFVK